MKVRILLCCLILGLTASAQTITPNLGMSEPAIGSLNWGPFLNGNFGIIDGLAGGTVPAPAMNINILKLGTAKLVVNDPITGSLLSSALAGTIPPALLPNPTPTTKGGVLSHSCGSSALDSINTDGSSSCAASSTGGNGGLFNSTTTSSVSGTGAFQTTYTYTLGSSLLTTSGGVEVFCGWLTSGTTATVRILFGGQAVIVGGLAVTYIGPITLHAHIYNQGALNSQWYTLDAFARNTADGLNQSWNFGANSLSVDTTASVPILCQIQQSSMGQNAGAGFYVNRVQQ